MSCVRPLELLANNFDIQNASSFKSHLTEALFRGDTFWLLGEVDSANPNGDTHTPGELVGEHLT
jgi:hypothetical protein